MVFEVLLALELQVAHLALKVASLAAVQSLVASETAHVFVKFVTLGTQHRRFCLVFTYNTNKYSGTGHRGKERERKEKKIQKKITRRHNHL